MRIFNLYSIAHLCYLFTSARVVHPSPKKCIERLPLHSPSSTPLFLTLRIIPLFCLPACRHSRRVCGIASPEHHLLRKETVHSTWNCLNSWISRPLLFRHCSNSLDLYMQRNKINKSFLGAFGFYMHFIHGRSAASDSSLYYQCNSSYQSNLYPTMPFCITHNHLLTANG